MSANIKMAEGLLAAFGNDMDFWWANADQGLILEFPYAGANLLPQRHVGLDAARSYLEMAVSMLKGISYSNVKIMPMVDEDTVVLEYQGSCQAKNGKYEQTYITIMRFKNGKLALFREYWDPSEVTRAFGSPDESK